MQESSSDETSGPKPVIPSSLMTTTEVADYLRVKERTIYEMVSRQTIPFTRATGKLLFPKRLVDAWLEAQTELPQTGVAPPPPIYAGSNDPLLEWALRQSGSGLAVRVAGSTQGLAEFASGRALLAGCHLVDPFSDTWNIPAVRSHLPGGSYVVIHWAKRIQGLIMAPGNPLGITDLEDAVRRGCRFALRGPGAGSQLLLEMLLARYGLSRDALVVAQNTVETHADLAAMIATGDADCGLGLQAAAGALGFLPLLDDECFDLVMARRDYFEPPIQALMAFATTREFARRADYLGGYDIAQCGAVRWNG